MSKNMSAYVSLIGAMVIVGSSLVAGKMVIQELPVFFVLALRFLIAVIICVPLLGKSLQVYATLSRTAWFRAGLQAFLGVFLYNIFILYGLKLTTGAAAGVVTGTTPAVMAVLAVLILRERPSGPVVLGIVLSTFGLTAVNSAGLEGSAGSLWGNMLIFGAVVGESVFLLMRKTLPEDLSPMAATGLISFIALLMFLPAGVYEFTRIDLSRVSAVTWAVVVYYGGAVTVGAYLLWFRGIVRVSGSAAGVFTAVMPVSAVVLSALFLGERLLFGHVIGLLCVLAGILCLAGPSRTMRLINSIRRVKSPHP